MRPFAGLAMAGAALTACHPVTPGPGPLANGEWRIAAVNGHATPAAGNYRMIIDGRRIGGQFGCNHFGGTYRWSGGLLVTDAVAMTEMACGEPASSFEGWGLAVLTRPMRVESPAAGRLRLSNERGSIDAVRAGG